MFSRADVEKAIHLGIDGIIVFNHDGRQLDAGQSIIKSLIKISTKYRDQLIVMMDGGICLDPDIARTMTSAAAFTFMGRPIMYGVSILDSKGVVSYHPFRF
ncbi:MAG: alpha-hydroxy-acid oxidizing protein [Flavobacteriales bacterium AspAUS03]